jgi:hypothetical protein
MDANSGLLRNADELGLEVMKISRPDKLPAVQEMIDEYQLLWKEIRAQIAVLKTECQDEIQKQVSCDCCVQHLVYCVHCMMGTFTRNIF